MTQISMLTVEWGSFTILYFELFTFVCFNIYYNNPSSYIYSSYSLEHLWGFNILKTADRAVCCDALLSDSPSHCLTHPADPAKNTLAGAGVSVALSPNG